MGLLDLWQLHYSAEGGKTYNVGQQLIANLSADKDQGHWISVSATADGSFTVINGRNKFEKSYRK